VDNGYTFSGPQVSRKVGSSLEGRIRCPVALGIETIGVVAGFMCGYCQVGKAFFKDSDAEVDEVLAGIGVGALWCLGLS
jgi:hypothetical protein